MEAAKREKNHDISGLPMTETCQNEVHDVYFRAGLLACREYMARFVEQGGNPEIAASIRANWWPSLGNDPGPPRLYDFNELADFDESTGKMSVKEIDASLEAVAHAHVFLTQRSL